MITMSVDKYILNSDGTFKIEPNLDKWARWMEGSNKVIKQDKVGDYMISTVFLGVDYSFGVKPDEPVLFETMIFRHGKDEYQTRYRTKEEALQNHLHLVEAIQEGKEID